MTKRKQGTGQPDPAKDRSAHDAARGVKQMALSDISKQLPTEDQIENYLDLLLDESDRGAAIMASGFAEQALQTAICSRVADHGETVRKSWFEGDNAPFATFSAKIQLGMALGIYADKMRDQLITIKNIRNQFAHCSVPLDFSHPAIVGAVRSLRNEELPELDKARARYCAMCLAIAQLLIVDAFEKGGQKFLIRYP